LKGLLVELHVFCTFKNCYLNTGSENMKMFSAARDICSKLKYYPKLILCKLQL